MSRSKDNVTVKFQGIYLLCQGYFEAGEDIHNVLVDSTDIMDLLDYQQLEELEHLALESFMDN